MLTTKDRRPAFRTLFGWATSVLLEAGAIRECEQHGWMKDRTDPHARERAFAIARLERPPGVSPQAASAAIAEALDSIGDSCPECPPDCG
jgi:hypothetical protein